MTEDDSAQSSALKYPWQRDELSAFLNAAADFDIFKNTAEVEFIVNFFFDDHDFYPDASKEIGLILFDAKEAEVMNLFVGMLDKAIGPKEKPLSQLTSEEWAPVPIAARKALAELSL